MNPVIEELHRMPSAIRLILDLVEEYRQDPSKWPRELILLAGGWPQDSPPETLISAMQRTNWNKTYTYSPSKGRRDFRTAISQLEAWVWKRDKVFPENILVGMGSTELTLATLLTFCSPNSDIIISNTYFLNYYKQARIAGLRVRYWPTLKNNVFSPDLNDLFDLDLSNTSAIIICSPDNPTGGVWSEKIMNELLEVCRAHDIKLILDQAYRAFYYEELFPKIPSYLRLPPEDTIINIMSFSKELKLCGWRMGYILSSKKNIELLSTTQGSHTLCPSSLQQEILMHLLLENPLTLSVYLIERNKLYRDTCKFAYALFSSLFKCYMPRGGFYLFPEIPIDMDSRTFCKKLLEYTQVAVVPGIDFGMDTHFRISFAQAVLKPQILMEARDRISGALHVIEED